MTSEQAWVRQLLGGPRGRRLCLQVAQRAPLITDPDGTTPWSPLFLDGGSASAVALAAAVSAVDLDRLAQVEDPTLLTDVLVETADCARYWQVPDEIDAALQDQRLADLLVPVAEALARCPAARWWRSGSDPHDQWHVVFDGGEQPGRQTAEQALAAWRRATVLDEQQAERDRPADPMAGWSGRWWSSPALSDLLSTTCRTPSSSRPVGVTVIEDSAGAERVDVRRAHVAPGVLVHEVTCPADWARLVAAFPLPVTSSRRHDWYRATGWRGEWLVPDWSAVATQWQGVHVSIAGYLSTAGRLIHLDPDDDAGPCTLLAGWNPGVTWWLSDVLRLGPPVTWTASAGSLEDWRPVVR